MFWLGRMFFLFLFFYFCLFTCLFYFGPDLKYSTLASNHFAAKDDPVFSILLPPPLAYWGYIEAWTTTSDV